ncbi:glycosyltransferase family 39 protein [Bradyrhizobium sp. AUGA SZCCT0158]|uniref:ArnT family glycosyltransferase n=1 Tax=Bradyrhizobium sp. AUGA SZCCT0158 TaxID=2807661 RepID=UPI001BAA939E|nr:glycosyltransferase family 39 protein [Bradyrhizobium sp. AUGA SZCCT0158]MBR1199477.1 glycosyltransferase family 39 protein [Bradyrhizobium sp. AUGA SZCCT0158]
MSLAFADRESSLLRLRSPLSGIFLAALAVRWSYALLIYAWMGDDGLKGVDSVTFAAQAQAFASAILAGNVHGSQWLGEAPYTMPLFQWLTALPFILAGKAGTIVYVLLQGVLDSGTCALTYLTARALNTRLALPSAIASILNPTQIVMSGLMYTDTPFTFFVALSLFLATNWADAPTRRNAMLLGCALGGAALIRVTIAPWGIGAIGLLAAFAWWKRKSLSEISSLAFAAAVLCVGLGMIAARSHAQYGTFALSPQGGDYLALWIVPLAKETQDRTPYATTVDDVIQRTAQRFGIPSSNPFEQSRRFQEIGWEFLRNEIKLTALAASWGSGIFINLVSPAHLLSPPVSALPRAGFYETRGDSFLGKVWNYAFRSGNALYSWLLILGSIGLAAVRAIQLLGIVSLLRQRQYWPRLAFAGSWIVFLLILNGPIASPKYRLPLEPLFNIMTGAGIVAILGNRGLASFRKQHTL